MKFLQLDFINFRHDRSPQSTFQNTTRLSKEVNLKTEIQSENTL